MMGPEYPAYIHQFSLPHILSLCFLTGQMGAWVMLFDMYSHNVAFLLTTM